MSAWAKHFQEASERSAFHGDEPVSRFHGDIPAPPILPLTAPSKTPWGAIGLGTLLLMWVGVEWGIHKFRKAGVRS
jgi:hypothetical protein